MSTIPQLAKHRDRAYELELKKARYGINVPPEVAIEARDLQTVISQMERIDIHRASLAHLLKQRANYAGQPPVHILNQISEARSEIMRLREICSGLEYPVPAHEVDSDEPARMPRVERPASAPQQSDIRSKLDQIERLLNEIRTLLP